MCRFRREFKNTVRLDYFAPLAMTVYPPSFAIASRKIALIRV